jgi:hypothetical protein
LFSVKLQLLCARKDKTTQSKLSYHLQQKYLAKDAYRENTYGHFFPICRLIACA